MAQAAAPTRTAPSGRPTRWTIFRQSFVSFAAVLAGYWAYWFLVVPLIEPNVEERLAQQQVTDEQFAMARNDITVRQRELAQYFQPNDWEANHPKFFNSGQMRVLFGDLITQPDGIVELKPCTLMFFPSETAPPPGRPIIMRTAKATLKFDQKIETKTVDFKDRRFLGGQIEGVVRIVQRESEPGKGDDLEITTSGVLMDSQRIYTPENVNFRMGRSRGIGRDLEIRLASADSGAQGASIRGLGVQTLQLKRDVRMSLVMGDGPLAAEAQQPAAPGSPPIADTIEITCAGMFEFDMRAYSAAFHQQVNVFRLDPRGGEGDQLNCQLLTVFFARPGEARPAQAPAAGATPSRSAASQVRLIEARGNPVTMRSPSQGMYARCTGVDYLPGAPGEPGSLVAFGPGVIHGNLPDDPAGKYSACWARELRFEPEGPLYRAGLHGAATINIGQMGEITSDEVFAWLSKQPKPAGQGAHTAGYRQAPPRSPLSSDVWQIERVLARRYQGEAASQSQDPVRIKSAQLNAETDILEATVARPPASAPGAAPGDAAPGAAPPAQQPLADPRRNPQNPDEKFLVHGGAVRLQLVPAGEQLAISGVTIEHNAELEQRSTAGGLEKRMLLVKGSRLHVTDAQTPATRITINGTPGIVETDGMSLWGGAIELEKISNRLWIEGPGGLKLPITQDLDGKPLARAQALTVDWKQGMNFQTATAVFRGTVVARSAQQVLNTETLEVTLNRPIDFNNPNLNTGQPNERLDVSGLVTRGWSFLESRQLDEQGQQQSLSQMGASDLSIDRSSGDLAGAGPGWVRHVAIGAPQALAPVPGGAPATPAAAPKPDDGKLTYLHVSFRKGLSGNLNRREVKFFDQTKTVYGPIKEWGEQLKGNDLASLGPSGMTLEADALEIREMGSRPQSKRGYFELDATGSVTADGQRFTALGDRLTYAEQNDQLALRGEPAAELFLENEGGGERRELRAKLVQYWFKDGRVGINGANNLVFPIPPSQPKPQPPTGAATSLPPSLGAPPTAALPR